MWPQKVTKKTYKIHYIFIKRKTQHEQKQQHMSGKTRDEKTPIASQNILKYHSNNLFIYFESIVKTVF